MNETLEAQSQQTTGIPQEQTNCQSNGDVAGLGSGTVSLSVGLATWHMDFRIALQQAVGLDSYDGLVSTQFRACAH